MNKQNTSDIFGPAKNQKNICSIAVFVIFIFSFFITPFVANGDEYEVILTENPQDSSRTDVYVRSPDTNTETFFITITDVYLQHYHNTEYHNGNLYILRRIGYDGYPDKTWSDQLWRYDSQKNGTLLYSDKGGDFRVAPDEEHIAVGNEDVIIVNKNGTVLNTYTLSDLGFGQNRDLVIALLRWSNDGRHLWGKVSFTAYPQFFYKISTESWNAETYDISNLGVNSDFDLNADRAKVAYSNYPTFFDVDSELEYEHSGGKVNLQIYDLESENNQVIATSTVEKFAPAWKDENTLEYNDPHRENRIQRVIE
jgi:hypothetical protein